MKSKSFDKINSILYIVLLSVYFVASFFLYYMQVKCAGLTPSDSLYGLFESDTAVHVRFAVEDHYFHSLSAFVYIALSFLPGYEAWIAGLLSLMTVGCIYFTKLLCQKIAECNGVTMSESVAVIISIFANFNMAFYAKFANARHYIGYENANMWHNSTYIFMRFFAVITWLLFVEIYESYKVSLKVKTWCLLTLLITLTTAFKASFLTVFAPALAIKLLIDLINGAKFGKVFALGCTVIPSGGVVFLENKVLFSDSDSGFAISPFEALSQRGDHPKIALVLSILFIAAVFVPHIKDFYKDKLYSFGILMWLIGFAEVFLFVETGDRSLDGNFFWGYSISLFFAFLLSAIRLFKDFCIAFSNEGRIVYKVYLFAVTLIGMWHLFSGVWYFCLLLTGVTYFV